MVTMMFPEYLDKGPLSTSQSRLLIPLFLPLDLHLIHITEARLDPLSRHSLVCKLQSELKNALPGSDVICVRGVGRSDRGLAGERLYVRNIVASGR